MITGKVVIEAKKSRAAKLFEEGATGRMVSMRLGVCYETASAWRRAWEEKTGKKATKGEWL